MSIPIVSFLEPANGNTFYLVEDKYVKGGLRVADDIATPNLNPLCAKAGMLIVDKLTKDIYQLQDDLTTLTKLQLGGGITYQDHGYVNTSVNIDPTIDVHFVTQGSFSFTVNILQPVNKPVLFTKIIMDHTYTGEVWGSFNINFVGYTDLFWKGDFPPTEYSKAGGTTIPDTDFIVIEAWTRDAGVTWFAESY